MLSYLCCFHWLRFSNKVQRSKGVRHDPSKHGHFREAAGGTSAGVYKRRKVSRMAGTISAEDVNDENAQQNNKSRSPIGSDISVSSGRNSPYTKNTKLTVPHLRGLGGKRFLTPSIAASTPDLRKAQENEIQDTYDKKIPLSSNNLNTTWLSSQSISNLSASNYELNISRSNSSNDFKEGDSGENSRRNSGSASDLTEKGGSQQQTRKRDFLMIPFLGGKKKIATSTPDISNVHGKLKPSKMGQSTFYLDKEPSDDDVIMAKQHGLDLEMYKNEAHQIVQSMDDTDSHRVTDKHIDYSYGTAVFSVSLKNGLLSVSLKKFQDLPYKGTKPLQYSVLVKIYIYPEHKKFPIRYAGSNGNKKSPNPIFEEDYHWNNLGSLENKSLCISVYEKGRQGNYDAIGHTLLHIGSAKLQEQPRVFSSSLRDVAMPSKNEGSIQLSLDFTSVGGKAIEICAFFAKGLHLSGMKSDETLSTFVKASFYVKGKKEKSKKSPIVKDIDPWYNHTFNFIVPSEAQLMDSLVVVSVVHKSGKLSQEQLVGKVIFGPYYFLKGTQTDWGNAILKGQKITRWYDLHMIN